MADERSLILYCSPTVAQVIQLTGFAMSANGKWEYMYLYNHLYFLLVIRQS